MSEPVELRERLERLANRGEDRGPEWLIASVNRALTEPAPSLEPARRPLRRPLITVAFAFAAVVAVVAAVVAFGPGGHFSPSPATTATSSTTPVSALDGQPAFFSSNDGWLCQSPLERTTDGGLTWQRIGVGTPGLTENGEACAFAPGGHAWVAMSPQPPDLELRVVRVVAGLHRAFAAAPLPGAGAGAAVVSLSFADALHGWALTSVSSGLAPSSTVYATTDGGGHWQRIATKVPVEGHLRFTSPTDGWGLSLTQLEHTTDGGRTWRTVPIAATPVLPENVTRQLWSVSVFGNRMVVAGLDPNRTGVEDFFVEVSNDGGAHWSLQLVAANDVAPPFAKPWQFVAVDADHWRYIDGRSFASTDDAGKTWRVQPNGGGEPSISFVSPDDAWVVRCTNSVCSSAVTHDDGKTWTVTVP